MADPKITISVSNKGKDGYTPQRGVDYWTDEDKQEIRDYVDERVEEAGGTGGSGGAVSSVNGKTGKVQLTAADVGAQPKGDYALKSELPSVPSKLSELSDDASHRLTTDAEKAAWNAKSDFSGKYGDLEGKPDIPVVPTKISAFTNDAGYLTEHQDLSDYAKKSDIPDTSAFITRAVNDLENYYKKSETYTRDEFDQRISAIPKFSIAVVYVLPTNDISETTIYLVPGGSDGDLYTEYIYVNGSWEVLGSQRVDLTGYATQSWTLEQLAGYQPKGNYLTEVTAENIKSALGYTPADAKEVDQLSEDMANHKGLTPAQISALDGMFKVCGYTEPAASAYAAFCAAFGIDVETILSTDYSTWITWGNAIQVTESGFTIICEQASYGAGIALGIFQMGKYGDYKDKTLKISFDVDAEFTSGNPLIPVNMSTYSAFPMYGYTENRTASAHIGDILSSSHFETIRTPGSFTWTDGAPGDDDYLGLYFYSYFVGTATLSNFKVEVVAA